MTDSMAGRWFVTAYNPDGTWSNSFQPHRNTNPWMLTKSPDDAPPGCWQQAERFVPAYHGHTFYGPNGDPDSYSLKDPFVREVRVRTKTECDGCDGSGYFVREHADPPFMKWGKCPKRCDGRGWYWKEETTTGYLTDWTGRQRRGKRSDG